jgi:choline dehydrogenase-like flavoprotein
MVFASVPPHGSSLHCDILIVGSGPAGITVASAMVGTQTSVILLDSGGMRETQEKRDLLRGFVFPSGSHEPLENNRRRQFGGTSNAWGGRCIPFDPIDLVKRDWIPLSGWPITWAELASYLPRSTDLCEVGDPVFNAMSAFPDGCSEMIAGFDGPDLSSSQLERWGPPTNFARRYGPQLGQSTNVTVLLNSTATTLRLDPGSRRVVTVEVAVATDHRFAISPGTVVLACGGIENARLLLASNDVIPGGIGNEFDNVGRCYMSHLTGSHAWATFTDHGRSLIFEFEKHMETYVRRRLWVTPMAQEREKIGNVTATFLTPYSDAAPQAGAFSSAIFLAKFGMGLFRHWNLEQIRAHRMKLLDHTFRVVRGAPRLVPQVAEAVKQRYLSKRRLPILLPRKEHLQNRFGLCYQSEHAPNSQSRVVLHGERDALGVPRAELRVAFSGIDVRTVVATHALIRNQLRATGTGDLIYNEDTLESDIVSRLTNFDSAAHHIGTTRMSSTAFDGVVDGNCRVHGTKNLFVAGSSVFATSGHANPTLMIVALAARLADHLRS